MRQLEIEDFGDAATGVEECLDDGSDVGLADSRGQKFELGLGQGGPLGAQNLNRLKQSRQVFRCEILLDTVIEKTAQYVAGTVSCSRRKTAILLREQVVFDVGEGDGADLPGCVVFSGDKSGEVAQFGAVAADGFPRPVKQVLVSDKGLNSRAYKHREPPSDVWPADRMMGLCGGAGSKSVLLD